MIYLKSEHKVIETMGLDRQKVKVKRGSQAYTPGDRRQSPNPKWNLQWFLQIITKSLQPQGQIPIDYRKQPVSQEKVMGNDKFKGWLEAALFTEIWGTQLSPIFQKFALCHFAFSEDLPLIGRSTVSVLLTERNPKRIFIFKKKARSTNTVQPFFGSESLQGQTHLEQREWPRQLLLREPHSASQHQAP